MRIELHDIHKRFGPVRANDGVSLTVASGTIHGLLGENGAGKTTLMKILSGYLPRDRGRILIDGQAVSFDSPADAIAAGIGMLHQDPLDVPSMTVLDNLMLGRSAQLLTRRRQAREALLGQCQRLGFALDPQALVQSLTVGERQQLELARLLSLGIRTIILDEPTTGISAPQRILLFETLRRLAQEGLSVIFVSHKLDEVEALCSQATVLREGRLAGEASAPFSQRELVRRMFGHELGEYPRPESSLGDVILGVDDLCVQTYRLNVEHLRLNVCAGEVIGLAGLEGSGQRLFMHACAGLEPVHSGRLLLDGRDMTHRPHSEYIAAGVAFIPAGRLEEGMVGAMTLREHFALRAQAPGLLIDWEEAERETLGAIREFNIVGRPGTPVRALSGGNQQRALLALLPKEVRLLLLEHPTRGLDVDSARWVWSRLLERRRQGTAILFTSTDLDELVEYSDRIVVFSGGVMSQPVDASRVTREELGYLIGGRRT
ncbi:MAG: ATP-binding cassette domain-containing protein [Anaerolineae bacterium]|nr:ATP-binding cassette domain-containing protein [Anaerolineae bacterium]